MSARMRENHWEMTARKRRKPGAGQLVRIPFDAAETVVANPADPPAEIALEATGPGGKPADWLDDPFWLPLLQAWSHERVTVRILPSPRGLLHPVVLHHVRMLRRVAPNWRVVGHCHVEDLSAAGALADAALSAYHEIHLTEAADSGEPRQGHALRLDDALARIRRVQVASNRHTPIVVCSRPRSASAPAQSPDGSARAARHRPVMSGK
jgi:hypothetical protein